MISKNHRCMHVLGNHIIPVQYNLVVVKYFSMGSSWATPSFSVQSELKENMCFSDYM